MNEVPVYLRGKGRGRGRGHGRGEEGPPPGSLITLPSSGGRGACKGLSVTPENSVQCAQKRFAAAKTRLETSVQRHLEKNNGDVDSSDNEDDVENHGTKILDNILSNFSAIAGNEDSDALGKTQDYLLNFFQPGSNVCLICFETMKKIQAVWSCSCCYCIFHMTCIQKWVRDGVYQKSVLSEENFPNRDVPWYCPKCRFEYSQSACPSRYVCYCGKLQDPPFDPWLTPHSCGDICDRHLKPECGHRCLLPCHPGPCPPCPQTVTVTCHCGRRDPVTRRCGHKLWSCGSPCGGPLACGHHRCQEPCHAGDCKPCPRSGLQRCVCSRSQTERSCASPVWHCDQPCGRPLLCGHHRCERVCHAGTCGVCPRSQNRFCPCGKTEHRLECTEEAPTCGDTCGKTLNCGLHACAQRCHQGPCGTCREMTEKRCRCESRIKSIQCCKDYQCDTKCANYKSCGKHQCRKKCCDGSCPPCELNCGKSLPCKNHKCSSPCHTGPCYPCPLTTAVSCYCGRTKVTVPCGWEKVTRPPRCRLDCQIPPNCHHPTRLRHRCHFGSCPPCAQTCAKTITCGHTCPKQCHSAVRRLVQEKVKRAGPWEAAPETREEVVDLPCPPCEVPLRVQCLGKHEVAELTCSSAESYSCGRSCVRRLACGNHQCQLECHEVVEAVDEVKAGRTCSVCEEACGAPRPPGCTHTCPSPCHPAPCSPCKQMLRMRCHCQAMLKHIECFKWNSADEEGKVALRTCGGICPKQLSCGHSCTLLCHPSPCPAANRCQENVSVKCPCKRRKKTFPCNDVMSGTTLACDDVCRKQKEEKSMAVEAEEKQREAEEEEKRRKELEEFERKSKGRGRRKRRVVDDVETSFLHKHGRHLLVSLLVLVMALFIVNLVKS